MPRLPAEGETVTDAYLRSITDEDAEAQLRDPVLWAYMLRDPTGAVCSHGHGKTRKECEERAITHAAECAEEAWPESRMWSAIKWQFKVWPPTMAMAGGHIANVKIMRQRLSGSSTEPPAACST